MDYTRCSEVFENLRVMNMIQTHSFFFFRINPKKNNSNSSLPPYSQRSLIDDSVSIPMALGLNISLSTFDTFLPVWEIIMISIIPSYISFIFPKTSKVFATWLNSVTVMDVN